jgi:hypothetical protein
MSSETISNKNGPLAGTKLLQIMEALTKLPMKLRTFNLASVLMLLVIQERVLLALSLAKT